MVRVILQTKLMTNFYKSNPQRTGHRGNTNPGDFSLLFNFQALHAMKGLVSGSSYDFEKGPGSKFGSRWNFDSEPDPINFFFLFFVSTFTSN